MAGEISLGADPELIFVGPKGIVSAGNYFDRQGNHAGQNPEIGADGHPWTAEIRPQAALTPRGLIENIRGILKRNHDKLPDDISWRAGSFIHRKAIGGHIHFGGVKADDTIITVLDGIVNQIIILLEDVEGARSRRAGPYGQLSDIRTKRWGFEYRPLPSWIVSDEIALGVIALAKAVVFEEVEQGKRRISALPKRDLRPIIDIDRRKYRTCDKDYFLGKLNELSSHVRSLSYFRTEEGRSLWKNVALLFHIARNYPDWHNDKDILHRWKIRDKTPKSYDFKRTTVKPIIELEEILQPNAGWERLAGANRR